MHRCSVGNVATSPLLQVIQGLVAMLVPVLLYTKDFKRHSLRQVMVRERIGMSSLPVVLLLWQIRLIFVFSLFVALLFLPRWAGHGQQ